MSPRYSPIRIRSEAAGSTLRAMLGDRCLASALMRRPYSSGPLYRISRSDGTEVETAESIGEARIKLLRVARAYDAELASKRDNKPATDQDGETAE